MLNLTAATTVAYFTSPQDWMIIGVIVLVLFGGTKIPQLARGFGEGIREFKQSMNGDSAASTSAETDASAH